MEALIYRPTKTAMQSGVANTRAWLLVFTPEVPRTIDPLMGWTGSSDMNAQVRLKFETKEEAIAYAQKRGISYRIIDPKPRAFKKRAYADNYRWDRVA